jgi:hypothetical protein
MYGGHSRTVSDVASEPPPRLSREEDVAAVFGEHDLERPNTQETLQSEESIGDDRAFAAVAGAAGAAVVGGAVVSRGRQGKGKEVEETDGKVADPHEAAKIYAGAVVPNQEGHNQESDYTGSKHLGDSSYADSRHDTNPESNYSNNQGGNTYNKQVSSPSAYPAMPSNYVDNNRPGGFLSTAALGGVAGGVGAAALYSSHSKDEANPSKDETNSSYAPPTAIETRPPVDKDVLPAALSGATASPTLSPPTNTIRRSKSKKEIVEETIADSIGNNPERGMLPGFWPETPANEVSEEGAFRKTGNY